MEHSRQNKSGREKGSINDRNRRKHGVLLALAALTVVGVLIGYRYLDAEEDLSLEEIQAQLQQDADDSDFRVQINSRISVKDQTADLLACNGIENSCNMTVTITGKDGTVYYESGEMIGQVTADVTLTAE